MPRQLVLASGSPRRRQLLEAAGYIIEIIVPEDAVEAAVSRSLAPSEFVAEAAFRKAKAVASTLEDAIVLAADTVAVCKNNILGKPIDRHHAVQMLKAMQGTVHHVLTGVTIWIRPTNCCLTHVESTELEMAPLSDDKIEAYVSTDRWMGKAGAFGYQDGLDWVKIITGYESNVVGLPIEILPDLIEHAHRQSPISS